MKIIRLFFGALIWAMVPVYAYADCSGTGDGIEGFIEWFLCALVTFIIGLFSACQEVPNFTGFKSSTIQLNVSSHQWINTGTTVPAGTAMQIHWGAEIGPQGVVVNPMRYAVMYRIDPRFARPQLFILTYNYNTNKYDSDFHLYNGGSLVSEQAGNNPLATSTKNYDNYFNFVNRYQMQVNPNDIVNISLIPSTTFLNYATSFNGNELVGSNMVANISTATGLNDNNIMYLDSTTYCNGLTAAKGCAAASLNPATSVYALGAAASSNLVAGILYDDAPSAICTAGSTGSNFQTPAYSANVTNYTYNPCVYDVGRAMPISVGGVVIKDVYTPFTYSNITGHNFFSYQATGGGALDFIAPSSDTYSMPISGMYQNQLMSGWAQLVSQQGGVVVDDVTSALAGVNTSTLYAGRYMMDIVVGGGNVSDFDAQNIIQVQYVLLQRIQ